MKTIKLNEEQIYHLIDLLEINIQDKEDNSHSIYSKDQIKRAIKYDKKIIKVLSKVVEV